MSVYYKHVLIPADHALYPSAQLVAEFLQAIIDLGVVGDSPTCEFRRFKRVPSRLIQGRNPHTGEVIAMRTATRWPQQSRFESVFELPQTASETSEYDIDVSGWALPRVAPLEIDFYEPYNLGVSCHVRAELISMSDLHPEAAAGRSAVPFGEDCTETDSLGVYTHPESLAIIEVLGAGCARFWIEFHLGKYLFPKVPDEDLRILNSKLVELAESCFRVQFYQGCHWG